MDSGLSYTNWSSLWSNQMHSLFNESSNELERDRNLINLNIICSTENISDINEECLQWLTHWESKQTPIYDTTTASTDITFTAIQTMESIVLDDFFSPNVTQISSDQTPVPLYKWPFLLLGILVFIGGFGNILVCLAIGFERRLQNATNYFLLRYSFDVCLHDIYSLSSNQMFLMCGQSGGGRSPRLSPGHAFWYSQ